MEFLIALSLTAQGDPRKKLTLAFKVYDQDHVRLVQLK